MPTNFLDIHAGRQLQDARIFQFPKPILRPAHTPILQRPQPDTSIVPRSPSPNMDRKQMVKERMSLARIRSLEEVCHGLLPFVGGSGNGVFEGFIKTNGIGQWCRVSE